MFLNSKESVTNKAKSSKKGRSLLDHDLLIIAAMNNDHATHDLIHTVLHYDNLSLNALTLLDTAALQGNYLSQRIAEQLRLRSTGPRMQISGTLSDIKTLASLGNSEINLTYLNELTNSSDTITIFVSIIEMPFDIIIGIPTLRQYKLLHYVKGHQYTLVWGSRVENYCKNLGRTLGCKTGPLYPYDMMKP
jgi:hypothetical protein